MTWLLIITVCLAHGGQAECRREIRHFPKQSDCTEIGKLTVDYINATESPQLIFAGGVCVPGIDG